MKQYIIAVAAVLLLSTSLIAQDADSTANKYGWKKEMAVGVNLTQTSFDNYVQGGENTLAWQLNYNFKFENDQEHFNWVNSGKLNYGMNKVNDDEMKKSIDEIKLESVYKYKLGIAVDPFVAATGETQFAPGYNYKVEPKVQISDLIDPIYFRESMGFGFKPNSSIGTRLGASLKQTITNDYSVPFADDPATAKIEKNRFEYGMESVTDLDINITKTSKLTSKLELFSNLVAFDEIDVNWDTVLTAKVSQYVNMNFNVKMIYDKDVSKKRQLKQALAVGLSYSFF